LLPFIVAGIVTGSVYGLTGVGLVLTYKTSGIFNFAHGAMGTVAAYLFYYLYVKHGVSWPLSLVLSVVVLGALMGVGMEALGKHIARTTLVWRIVATVGIVLIVEGAFTIIQGTSTYTVPHFLPTSTVKIFGTNVSWEQITITAISVVATGALYAFFRLARTGKAMRAVVDDPDLLGLSGTNPSKVRRWAWAIGCTFATLSGVLLAPAVSLNPTVLTLLVVQAFGAAAIGRFSNLPMTWVGGVAIGVVASLLTKYINSTGIWSGLPPSLPFLVLFLVILLSPRARAASRQMGVVRASIPWRAPGRVQLVGAVITAAFLLSVPAWTGYHLSSWTLALTYVVLFLALGFLTRTSGQISLCHASFAAIGAVAFSKLSHGAGVPWIPALLVAGLVAVPIGALLAIPAIRLSGLYLALATFGFGLVLQDMFYQSDLMFGATNAGIPMPLPHLSWLHVDTTTGFYYVVLSIAALTSVILVVLTHSRLGRLLRALSDSPVALTTSGATVNVTQVLVFCISAYVAAIAGALSGMTLSTVTGTSFPPTASLTYMALIVITIGGDPWYALLAGAGIGLVPSYFTSSQTSDYLQIIFGVAAVVGALGIRQDVPALARKFLDRVGRSHVDVPLHPDIASLARVECRPMALEVKDVSVRFGGLVAVNKLSLEAMPRAITGLIGPNGAGKTTTFNVCSGLVSPTAGSISLEGRNITKMSSARRARRGLGRTFQQMELFDSLSVLDNVVVGYEASLAGANAWSQVAAKRGDHARSHAVAMSNLELCGLQGLSGAQVGSLSTGQRRLVELARCLAGPFSMLLLDEPSSGLDRSETKEFGETLQRVVVERGIGVLLVEHDMSLVMDVCDDIYVLDFGTLIFHGSPDEVQRSEIVRDAYLGTEGVSAALDETGVGSQS
jgi:ABC-type branched-subunit amino acid transport system ATPase component/branched-subunit amino acid ABC-type transport system permease component